MDDRLEMTTLGKVFDRLLTYQNNQVLPNFDCVVQCAWNTFKFSEGTAQLDLTTIERVIRKCLDGRPEPTPANALRLQLLHFLTRLADGESHYLFQYNPSPDAETYSSTVLESALCSFDRIFKHFPDRNDKAAELRLKILQQAVFVCCRQGNFAMAKNVYEFAELEVNVDEVVWDELKAIVETEDPSHPALYENSYQQFCKLMTEELEFLVAYLDLQECAEGCAAHVRSVHSEDEQEERIAKFNEDILRKLLHVNIESWLPREHRAILEKECLNSERLNDRNIRSAACNINIALCQMDLLKELPRDQI